MMALVAAAAALVCLGWLGAQAACLATSGHLLRVGFSGSARAIARLPRSWSDPRAAWPEPARARLPGPVAYWATTAVVLGVGATAAALVWRSLAVPVGSRKRRRLGVQPQARLAARRDTRPLV